MRNLLHQFKRAAGHMKSIIMKLMSKMTKGATVSARALVEGVTVAVAVPLAIILLAVNVICLVLFAAFGGVPAEIARNKRNNVTVPVASTVH